MVNPHKRMIQLFTASNRGFRTGIASIQARDQMYESMKQMKHAETKARIKYTIEKNNGQSHEDFREEWGI